MSTTEYEYSEELLKYLYMIVIRDKIRSICSYFNTNYLINNSYKVKYEY